MLLTILNIRTPVGCQRLETVFEANFFDQLCHLQ
jgi:hypothetical protein